MRKLFSTLAIAVMIGVFGLSGAAHATSPYPIVQTTCSSTTLYKDAALTVPATYAPGWGMVFYREGGTDPVWQVVGPVSRYPASTYYANSACFRVQGAVQYKVTPTCSPTALYKDRALTQVAFADGLDGATWGYIGGDANVSEVLPTMPLQMVLPTSYYARTSCFVRA